MRVIITPKASKQFDKLPITEKVKIQKKLQVLEANPLSGKKLSGELTELRSFRAWPYRIIYYIDDKKDTLYVASIIHRQGVY